MIRKTAILIFANTAEKEAERKGFLSAEIFSALNKHTFKIVEKSNIPYFHISENNQVGCTFGERFANAIASIFYKGFENVITIGNDTPHLKTQHLLNTLQKLATKDMVLGPSKDGGFYLMGIKSNHFNKEMFLNLPWQTNSLRQSLSQLLNSKNLNTLFLEPLNDIDSKEDLQFIIHSSRAFSSTILKLLQELFFACMPSFYLQQVHYSATSFSQNFNKGSPIKVA